MKAMRLNPDTLRFEEYDDSMPEPRPIPPLPKKGSLFAIKTLPEWIDTEVSPLKPTDVTVSVFDRFYLLYNQTLTYSRWAFQLLKFTIALIAFIQSLKKEK
jgi:hypothetical protein